MFLRALQKAQSILEYTVLVSVVLSALLVMQFYVKRSYQGRLKIEADGIGQQYSPKHTVSHIVTEQALVTETYTGGKTDSAGPAGKEVAIPDGMSLIYSNMSTTFTKKEAVDSFAKD